VCNGGWSELLEATPDEMHPWIQSVVDQCTRTFDMLAFKRDDLMIKVMFMSSRKEQALFLKDKDATIRPSVFMMLDAAEFARADDFVSAWKCHHDSDSVLRKACKPPFEKARIFACQNSTDTSTLVA
jgi:hypothetical protein